MRSSLVPLVPSQNPLDQNPHPDGKTMHALAEKLKLNKKQVGCSSISIHLDADSYAEMGFGVLFKTRSPISLKENAAKRIS